MELGAAEAGFPELNGYTMHAHVDCQSPVSITLWFYRPADDLSVMMNTHVFLIGAYMRRTNVEITSSLPAMKSYTVTEHVLHGRKINILDINFEKGDMSIAFQKAFHVRSVQPLGSVPDELKMRLGRK